MRAAMLAVLLVPAFALAPGAAATETCVAAVCALYDASREGGYSMQCTAPGQSSTREAMLTTGDAWVAYAERCDEDTGLATVQQGVAVGALGQDAYILWYVGGKADERVCWMDVDGAVVPCVAPPPALP